MAKNPSPSASQVSPHFQMRKVKPGVLPPEWKEQVVLGITQGLFPSGVFKDTLIFTCWCVFPLALGEILAR